MCKQPNGVVVSLFLSLASLLMACNPDDTTRSDEPTDCSCEVMTQGERHSLACGEEACWLGVKVRCGPTAELIELTEACGTVEPTPTPTPAPTPQPGPGPAPQPNPQPQPGPDPEPILTDAWTAVSLKTSAHLRALATPQNLFDRRLLIVGDEGTCFHLTGFSKEGVEPCRLPEASAFDFTSAAMEGTRSAIAGRAGALFVQDLVSDEGRWKRVTLPTGTADDAYQLAAVGSTLYAVGNKGFVGKLLPGDSPQLVPLEGVSTAGNAWRGLGLTRVGANDEGFVLEGPRALWRFSVTPTAASVSKYDDPFSTFHINALLTLHRTGSRPMSELVLVGDKGEIYSELYGIWDWQTTAMTTENLHGVFEGVDGIYAIGAGGTVLRRELVGDSWVKQETGVTHTLRSGLRRVSSSGAHEVIVGDHGTLLVRQVSP